MKTIIICKSVHNGCTGKIAGAVSEIFAAEVLNPEEVSGEDILKSELVGFGSGIYAGKFHKSMLALVKTIENAEGKKAFVFSTSAEGGERYNGPFKELLASKGFDVAGSFACKGLSTFGPLKLFGGMNKGRPDESDIEAARKFADRVRTELGKQA